MAQLAGKVVLITGGIGAAAARACGRADDSSYCAGSIHLMHGGFVAA